MNDQAPVPAIAPDQFTTPPLEILHGRLGRKWSRYPVDVLPAWIADMDFLPAPSIAAALHDAVHSGDLGYGPLSKDTGLPESFSRWALERWDWDVDPDAVMVMPDVVGGIANCVEALTARGEGILVQTPIYPPFQSCIKAEGRRLVTHELNSGRIDFDSLNVTVREQRVRMILFCNPHNPTGRCFTRAELAALSTLVLEHDLIVVSDEVHADLVFSDHRHIPLASLNADVAARTVTLNSASKAFNIAGLRAAVCVTTNPELRARLRSLPANRWSPFSILGVRATLAAWSTDGNAWLNVCLTHLADMRERLSQRLPEVSQQIRWIPPAASYLAWLDCRDLALPVEPDVFFLRHARVALSPGVDFGDSGRGHVRLNFGTSSEILDAILERMADACARKEQR